MKLNEKYLPIGTVVKLTGQLNRFMITGFCPIEANDENTEWDYMGCFFPEGIADSRKANLFNHEQIKSIEYIGFIDDEEKEFKARLQEWL